MKAVDAHHHVWSLARGDYAWLTPAQAPIYRDFDLADYGRAAPQIATSVLVQAAPTTAETRYLLELAHASAGRVAGVVGWVDLDAETAPAELAELARDPLFKSVRPMLQDLDDPEWILRPRVMQALGVLPSLGLRFDALVRPVHLLALSRMVEVHSELFVVIDHAAKPDIASGEWEPWAGAMRDLALHPHVHCKLSGLVSEAGPEWNVDTLSPYVDHVLAHFGAGRVMWGSDWPVVGLNGGYDRWWQATLTLLAPLEDADRAAILSGNARRFYRLPLAPSGGNVVA
jgi:L-fuconolactonase